MPLFKEEDEEEEEEEEEEGEEVECPLDEGFECESSSTTSIEVRNEEGWKRRLSSKPRWHT
jgi:hypothetical protein